MSSKNKKNSPNVKNQSKGSAKDHGKAAAKSASKQPIKNSAKGSAKPISAVKGGGVKSETSKHQHSKSNNSSKAPASKVVPHKTGKGASEKSFDKNAKHAGKGSGADSYHGSGKSKAHPNKANDKASNKTAGAKNKEKHSQAAAEKLFEKNFAKNESNKVLDKSEILAKKKNQPDPKKSIGSNPPKKQKKKEEFEDEILETDDELGGEEIPDLSEFEEDLEAEGEDVEVIEVEESSQVTSAEINIVAKPKSDEEVILTDAEGRRYCRVRECDQAAIVEGYCRFHYLALWKKIQIRRKILVDGKLERYVEELTSRYPDKFLEVIRKDLRTEKDFMGAIAELEIDDSGVENELEDEAQSYIDEVRGMSETNISEDDEY